MGDLETLLQDFSYLKSLEHKNVAPTKADKKLWLPDPSVCHSVLWYWNKSDGPQLQSVLSESLGVRCFREFCESSALNDGGKGLKCVDLLTAVEDLTSELPLVALQQVKDIMQKYIHDKAVQSVWQAQPAEVEALSKRVAHLEKIAKSQPQVDDWAKVDWNQSKKEVFLVSHKSLFSAFAAMARGYLAGTPWEQFKTSRQWTRYCQWKHLELNMMVNERDFDVHRILGRGGFGEVYGCRKHDTGAMFALKKLEKKRLKLKHQETSAVHEKNVLSLMNSNFVTNLKYAFQTHDDLYLVMDLMEGGDLSWHLKQVKVFTVWQAKFYAAQIALGLAHIHSRGLLYRDLKPANVLLDANGNARISDLGLVRDLMSSKPTSECGTHGYMAPEVIQPGVEYGYPADWWSFGCCIHHFLTGSPPFTKPGERAKKKDLILRCVTDDVTFPDDIDPLARSLIEDLLIKDPAQRLGSKEGARDIRHHKFFTGLDWSAVLDHKIPPPIKPHQGRVNARDVIEIDTFNYKETKKIKITDEENRKYYWRFEHVTAEHWQKEVMVVYDLVTKKANDMEAKSQPFPAIADCIMQGLCLLKTSGLLRSSYAKRYYAIFPDRLELHTPRQKKPEKTVFQFADIVDVTDSSVSKLTLSVTLKEGKPLDIKFEYRSDFACFHDVLTPVWAEFNGKTHRPSELSCHHVPAQSAKPGDDLEEEAHALVEPAVVQAQV